MKLCKIVCISGNFSLLVRCYTVKSVEYYQAQDTHFVDLIVIDTA